MNWLSSSARETWCALAETAIPAGERFPAAGRATIDKLESWMEGMSFALRGTFVALLAGLEHGSWPAYRRPFSRLESDKRFDYLLSWHHGPYPQRMALRTLLTPLKVAHFSDTHIFELLQCRIPAKTTETDRPRYLDRVHSGQKLSSQEDLTCDVVIIGTGAGGAVVAKELAERGCAVVMLEEGDFFTRKDFSGRTVEMQRLLYRDFGATITLGNAPIVVPIGKAVGGTTVVNSGTCYRAPARVFAKWRNDLGLGDMTPDHLAPYYERVEGILGVAPAHWNQLGGVAKVIARGCEALGYKHNPLLRNAPDCDGQGVCCFGCPTDAKRSMNVSYIPLALRSGAELFCSTHVTRILLENGRAVGVEAKTSGGGVLRVQAKAVVVACGTLLTPIFLAENRLGGQSGQLGRNLSIHPAVAVAAIFRESIQGYNAIPQGYAIEQFHDEGLLFEGAFLPPDLASASLQFFGPHFTRVMEAYDRIAIFGFLMEDESRGRVRRGPNGRPLISYWLNDADVARVKRGVEILSRIYFAAGCQSVLPLVHGFDEFKSERDLERFRHASVRARDFDFSAYHPLGTARIAGDKKLGVCNAEHQMWDVPSLYVVDGSSIPTSLAVNPQMTIMALATRAAEFIARL